MGIIMPSCCSCSYLTLLHFTCTKKKNISINKNNNNCTTFFNSEETNAVQSFFSCYRLWKTDCRKKYSNQVGSQQQQQTLHVLCVWSAIVVVLFTRLFLIVCPIHYDKETEGDRSLSIWLQKINGKAFFSLSFIEMTNSQPRYMHICKM